MKKITLSPTVLFLVTFTVGMVLTYLLPWHFTRYFDHKVISILGLAFLSIIFILNFLAYRMFRKHSTSHAPFSTPVELIDNGVFAFSRNPVYLALVLSQCGLGFIFDTLWLIFTSVVLFVALHYLVVLDEEIVLQRGFKEKYERYKDRTRRWM